MSANANAVGVDIIEIERVEAALGRFGERFLARVYLYGRAKERAERIGMEGMDVSLSHSREYAVAFVVGQSADLEPEREAWRGELVGILRERGMLESRT